MPSLRPDSGRLADEQVLIEIAKSITAGEIDPQQIERCSRDELATIVWSFLKDKPDTGISELATVTKRTAKDLTALLLKEAQHEIARGKRAPRAHWLEAILVLGLLVVCVRVASIIGGDDAGSADLKGFRQAATRTFRGPVLLGFTVVEFATPDHAHDGLAVLADRLEHGPEQPGVVAPSALRPLTAKEIRDEIRGYAGVVEVGDAELGVTFLLIRNDRYVHIMQRVAITDDPRSGLESVARRLFGLEPYPLSAALPATPATGNGFRTGGLWDQLPRPEHLPGFVLDGEDTGLSETLFGGADMTRPSTPRERRAL